MLNTYSVEVREELKRTIAIAIVNKAVRASMVTIRLRDLAEYASTPLARRIRIAYDANPLGLTFTVSRFNRIMISLVEQGLASRIKMHMLLLGDCQLETG